MDYRLEVVVWCEVMKSRNAVYVILDLYLVIIGGLGLGWLFSRTGGSTLASFSTTVTINLDKKIYATSAKAMMDKRKTRDVQFIAIAQHGSDAPFNRISTLITHITSNNIFPTPPA